MIFGGQLHQRLVQYMPQVLGTSYMYVMSYSVYIILSICGQGTIYGSHTWSRGPHVATIVAIVVRDTDLGGPITKILFWYKFWFRTVPLGTKVLKK